MPIALLLLLAVVAGALATIAFSRLAPSQGATASTAHALEMAVDQAVRRRAWRNARVDPNVLTGLALTVAVLGTVACGLVIALLAYLVRSSSALHAIDASAARWGDDNATHLSTRLLSLVTDLGDRPVVPALAIFVAVVELRRVRGRSIVPFLLVVTLGNQVVTTVIKGLIERARPGFNPIAATLGPSFPSGHSSTAASFYAAVALILSRGRGARERALLAGASVGIAVAVAASRVLLDVHWLSDVIAGLSLGWAWFALCAIAFGGRLLRFAAPLDPVAGPTSTPKDEV